MAVTPNYGFFLPTESDDMSDVRANLTNSFETIASRGEPTVIAAGNPLPQAGNYELGDRVFRNDVAGGNTWPSSYLLICKDANWGWHWRPLQQTVSPWVDVPATAIDMTADWEIHPTHKLQIALDSRGWCHWRGVVRKKTAGIVPATSYNVFKNIPLGIRTNVKLMHTCAINPVVSGTGKAGNVSGRIYLDETGHSSFRTFNTNNGISQNIWLDGLTYNNSYHWYYSG